MTKPTIGQTDPNWGQTLNSHLDALDVTLPGSAAAVALSATYARIRPLDPRAYGAVGDGVADDTTALQNCLTAAGSGAVELPPLTFKITGTLTVPSGCELRGIGPKGATISTNGDFIALKTVGGEGHAFRNFKIANAFTGTRTTFDIEIVNPFHPVIEDVEIALAQTSLVKGGVRLYKDAGQTGSDKCFMPVLRNLWVRNGVLKIENITDIKVEGGWVWSTYTTAPGAVELVGASNCSFKDLDIVPSVNAGYLISGGLTNLTITGGLMDGNGDAAIHPGPGIKSTDYVRGLTVSQVKFWNLWTSAIDLSNVRAVVLTGNTFRANNRADTSSPEINIASGSSISVIGNTFSAQDSRTNKGKVYVEDGTSSDNIIAFNVVEYDNGLTNGNYYDTAMFTVQASTLVTRNRPDVSWPQTGLLVKSADYTVTKFDLFGERTIHATGTTTITLPSAGSVHSGDKITVKNTGTANVTIATTSAQTIDGGPTSLTLRPGQSDTFMSNGTGWQITTSRAVAPALIAPPLAFLATISATAWPAANTAIFQRFTVPEGRTYRYVNFRLDGASGNYQIAVVRLSGSGLTDYTRVMDTTVVAAPTAGDKHIDLGATLLTPGEYAMVLWFDNITATTRVASNSGVSSSKQSAEVASLTTGVPASGTGLAWSSTRFLGGVTVEADV